MNVSMWTADEIAILCYNHFSIKLPKKGMVNPKREWTLLAAVVKVEVLRELEPKLGQNSKDVTKEVVAMGTGTKCIGQAMMSKSGNILNDSHAEVVAQRSFHRYLYSQLLFAVQGQSSIFVPGVTAGKWMLKPGISFVFFTSQTPCGDASIIPKKVPEEQLHLPFTEDDMVLQEPWWNQDKMYDSVYKPQRKEKRKNESLEDETNECYKKRLKDKSGDIFLRLATDFGADEVIPENESPRSRCENVSKKDSVLVAKQGEGGFSAPAGSEYCVNARTRETADARVIDVHRTGAKVTPGGPQDTHGLGADYHCVGLLRVKPGRGDRTLSMSCSDKMARWNVLGCQGALLMHFLQEPLYLCAVVIGECPYSEEAMRRALIDRCRMVCHLPGGFRVHEVQLLQATLEFEISRNMAQQKHDPSLGRLVSSGTGPRFAKQNFSSCSSN
ncbi:tRNA-specific adenosine deaminase 1 isoform X2 [Protopterus annectens]|uniref:tRNA-specific adenosine deaminase 1 isoform X2 n=1 Tax=Protopterus annectens TaxID=7888 RepID=UPI001CF94DE1|nr:tRNA-specific adenosine deaminase 1 isoform X2 [Protopterus annectens]